MQSHQLFHSALIVLFISIVHLGALIQNGLFTSRLLEACIQAGQICALMQIHALMRRNTAQIRITA
ncbi:hypothetical protein HMPREF3087_04440 [Brevibacterium sp. HMSC22B09]|nr:hypothetical protein HMPREF3087_04440 [Brevibacterium sp. HMSC22B09]